MSPQDFTYWLQGFFEISNSNSLTEQQVKIIKDHLGLIFKRETTNFSSKGYEFTPLTQAFKPKYPDVPLNTQGMISC